MPIVYLENEMFSWMLPRAQSMFYWWIFYGHSADENIYSSTETGGELEESRLAEYKVLFGEGS